MIDVFECMSAVNQVGIAESFKLSINNYMMYTLRGFGGEKMVDKKG